MSRTVGRWALAAGATAMLMIAALLTCARVASAEDNGVSLKPVMGWSSWDFLRHDPTEATVEAQAKAMVTSGLKAVGYRYVNVDDDWYECPGSQGPDVDRYGRWVPIPASFPAQGSVNGIEATANYVHSLGLKFGIYVTPGISKQAVAENTRIAGTRDRARGIATTTPERNYNCGGMVGIDYAKPGAQAFIDSWADEFASWGVDYVKLDGVGRSDISDVKAWSAALRQTHRPIQLELSNNLAISDVTTWQQYANGWRTGGDIDCYCSTTSYPLTDWSNVMTRFNQVAEWAPYGKPGAFNDYDTIDVGNGANDGLTPPERQTQMSLWALGSSPFILGTDLTHLTALDRSYLLNRSVISVDQDGIDAHRIVNAHTTQVFTKRERSGDAVVGLFNTGSAPQLITTSAAALGLARGSDYSVSNLWDHTVHESAGRISEEVPARGVALLRVAAARSTQQVAQLAPLSVSGPAAVPGGDSFTEKVSFTDEGLQSIHGLRLTLDAPSGWSVTQTTPVSAAAIAAGRTETAGFRVTVPAAAQPFQAGKLTAGSVDEWGGRTQHETTSTPVTLTGSAVQAPLRTYSSATDAPARFSEVGDQLGVQGAGTDLYSDGDDYSAIYRSGVVGSTTAVTAEVTSEQGLTGYAKAGIMVRNDIAGSGRTPEGVVLYESPSGGVQLEYDGNGKQDLDAVTPANGTIPVTSPVYLRLVRAGDAYTGYYSTDDANWQLVGAVTVPDQAATQDAGVFEVSQAAGVPGVATFSGFSVS